MTSPFTPIGEDAVEYWVYPVEETKLDDLLAAACQLSADYVWHHEGFQLQAQESGGKPYWHGRTRFEDNLEDEWYIVSLLRLLTRRFQIAVRVTDSDGEILLIEGSDHLPRWVSPNLTENRVFLYHGEVHLIPPPGKTNSLGKKAKSTSTSTLLPLHVTSPFHAVEILRSHARLTLAPARLQTAVSARLAGYHDEDCRRVREMRHRAEVALPPRLALLIRALPRSVGPAARAFYLRDPYDLKCCRELRHFGEGLSQGPLEILDSVLFTKAHYAMLKQQPCVPDRRSLIRLPRPQDPAFSAHQIGLKLVYGYEILCCRAEERRKKEGNANGSTGKARDARWEAFKTSLKDNGYFRGEVVGSELHQRLIAQAQLFYNSSVAQSAKDPAMDILDRLSMIDSSSAEDILAQAKKGACRQAPDDEIWLSSVPPDLNGPPLNGTARSQSSTLDSDDEKPVNGSSGGRKRKRRRKRKGLAGQVEEFLVQGTGPAAEGAEPLRRHKPESDCGGSDLIEESGDSIDEDTELDEQELRELASFGASMSSYMASMDKELASTAMGSSFVKAAKSTAPTLQPPKDARKTSASPGADSIDLEDDEFASVDIDSNLVSNMLTGYCAEQKQGGGAATALLRSLSIKDGKPTLPPLDSDDDDYEPGI